MQKNGLGHLLGHDGITHAADILAIVRHQELRMPFRQPRSQLGRRQKKFYQFIDLRRAVVPVIGGMPCLHEQVVDLPEILLAGRAYEIHWAYSSSMPSLALTRACTACGLALPPVDFITWPANQPASVGFALTLV